MSAPPKKLPAIVKLNSGIIVQENKHYCGPASAQSVLTELGVVLAQDTIYKHIRKTHTSDYRRKRKWSSPPDALTEVLNSYQKEFKRPNENCEFELYAFKYKKVAVRKMISAIAEYNISCINLIDKGDHWIAVYGYQLIPFLGIFVNDPIQEDTQGLFSYLSWSKKLAFPVDSGLWKNKYLVICDPDPNKWKFKGEKPLNMPKKFPQQAKSGKPFMKDNPINAAVLPKILKIPAKNPPGKTFIQNPIINGKNLIDEPTAKTYAKWWLDFGGFYNSKMFKVYMPNLLTGNPVLVRELGSNHFHYLVPLINANKVYAILNISAGDANLREFTCTADAKKTFSFTPMTDDELRIMIKKKYPTIKNIKELPIPKTLVWKYCKQSMTENQPFHMITMGKRTLFIRLDKKMFTRLT
jgi:hypothetical protein